MKNLTQKVNNAQQKEIKFLKEAVRLRKHLEKLSEYTSTVNIHERNTDCLVIYSDCAKAALSEFLIFAKREQIDYLTSIANKKIYKMIKELVGGHDFVNVEIKDIVTLLPTQRELSITQILADLD